MGADLTNQLNSRPKWTGTFEFWPGLAHLLGLSHTRNGTTRDVEELIENNHNDLEIADKGYKL